MKNYAEDLSGLKAAGETSQHYSCYKNKLLRVKFSFAETTAEDSDGITKTTSNEIIELIPARLN